MDRLSNVESTAELVKYMGYISPNKKNPPLPSRREGSPCSLKVSLVSRRQTASLSGADGGQKWLYARLMDEEDHSRIFITQEIAA